MILEALGAFGGLIVAVGAAVSFAFLGGRRWRNNYDASEAAHGITKEKLAAERATNEQQEGQIARMVARLERLDEERKEFVGSKAYDAIVAQSDELRRLNDTLAELSAYLQRGDDC